MEAADGTTGGEGKGMAARPHFLEQTTGRRTLPWKHTERMETPLQLAWDHLETGGLQSASGAEPIPGLVAACLLYHFRAFSQTFGLFLSCRVKVVVLLSSDTSHTHSFHRAFLPSPTTQQCCRNWALEQKRKASSSLAGKFILSSSPQAAVIVPLLLALDVGHANKMLPCNGAGTLSVSAWFLAW